ncbi:MAG: flagellar biosynthesis anti-sigma factor FlgM [Acidocella sp. 20-63-7]|nr:MAG: flagellar biosynthesis anti-sigma factor FlgM [Acidocella sp. 20-63-7]HQT47190.1 flagellar biosynthesis anti-sigma factor FlgM [Acidocella sp.]
MSSTISPFAQTPPPAQAAPQATTPPAAPSAAPSAQTSSTAQSDSVTLSAAAQTSTQLLNAARNSDGINHAAVAQIRSAIQSGTYNVAPEKLAQAIATVLKETK